MNEIYQKKSEYEKNINKLYTISERMKKYILNLYMCKKELEKCLTIDNEVFQKHEIDIIIEKTKNYEQKITEIYIPKIKEEYNEILIKFNNI